MTAPVTLERYSFEDGQWIDLATGEPVPQSVIDAEMDRMIGTTSDNAEGITALFFAGAIGLAAWRLAMSAELKDAHIALALYANPEGDDFEGVSVFLASQYTFLDGFAAALAAGELTIDAARSRARMYGNAIRTTYWNVRTGVAKVLGNKQERRVLNPAEHCDDCVAFAAQGWVEIDTLPSPGIDSQCLSNCQCSMQYRKRPTSVG